jgi:phosphoglycerol transferase MdoB-like AlkP superfamily enzyme
MHFRLSARPRRVPVAALVGSIVAAAACNALLDLSQSQILSPYSPNAVTSLQLFALSTLVIWPGVVLAILLTGRFWGGVGFAITTTALVSIANRHKLSYRFEPLYPSDLEFGKEAGFLIDFLTVLELSLTIALLVLLVALVYLMARMWPNAFRLGTLGSVQPRGLVIRCVAALCCVGALSYSAQFNATGNQLRAWFEHRGADWQEWSQKRNYAYNGFVPAFLYNVDAIAMDAPTDYSEPTMMEIARRYQRIASSMNEGRAPDSLAGINIVLVLAESFTDPTAIPGVSFAKDPIPFTREVMQQVPSGWTWAQSYGGGTANMEFSALTGHSVGTFSPQMNTPYQQLVRHEPQYPSAAGYLKKLGYRTVAIHPFKESLYARDRVYPSMGFDEYLFADRMRNHAVLDPGHFISDEAAFREVDQTIADTDEPVFVNLVTMQNHLPVDDKYPDPISVIGKDYRSDELALGQYARGLRHTDSSLRAWLTRLQATDEKTVVLYYGDHHPGLWSEKRIRTLGEDRFRRTPFFVWRNFGDQRHMHLPTTSPIHFMNRVLDAAQAPVPPYYALLRSLEQELPTVEGSTLIGPDGEPLAPAQLGARAQRLLRDYRLVQYDFSVGERYALNAMFYPLDGSAIQASR